MREKKAPQDVEEETTVLLDEINKTNEVRINITESTEEVDRIMIENLDLNIMVHQLPQLFTQAFSC